MVNKSGEWSHNMRPYVITPVKTHVSHKRANTMTASVLTSERSAFTHTHNERVYARVENS